MLAGSIDAGIQGFSIVLGAATKPQGKLEVVGQILTDEAYGIMMQEGSPNLETINKILADLKVGGTLDKLSASYLVEASGVDPAIIPIWDVK